MKKQTKDKLIKFVIFAIISLFYRIFGIIALGITFALLGILVGMYALYALFSEVKIVKGMFVAFFALLLLYIAIGCCTGSI